MPSYLLQVKENKRYAAAPDFTVSEVAAKAAKDMGKIDILVSAHELTLPLSSHRTLILRQTKEHTGLGTEGTCECRSTLSPTALRSRSL